MSQKVYRAIHSQAGKFEAGEILTEEQLAATGLTAEQWLQRGQIEDVTGRITLGTKPTGSAEDRKGRGK